jgi:hypothetical protein
MKNLTIASKLTVLPLRFGMVSSLAGRPARAPFAALRLSKKYLMNSMKKVKAARSGGCRLLEIDVHRALHRRQIAGNLATLFSAYP